MKLFASDYDGTLHLNGSVSDSTIEAIHKFKNAGNTFGIATGRSISSIAAEIDKYKIPVDFLIGNNGGIVLNQHNEELFYQLMDFEVALKIIADIPQDKIVYYGVSDGYQFGLHDNMAAEQDGDFADKLVDVAKILESKTAVGMFLRFDGRESRSEEHFADKLVDVQKILESKTAVGMFLRFDGRESSAQFADYINGTYGDQVKAYNFGDYIDIISYGITKKTGIGYINDHIQHNGPIFTIGDSYNDIPMIKGFNGFAMCSGEEEVKKYASRCFDTVEAALEFVMSLD